MNNKFYTRDGKEYALSITVGDMDALREAGLDLDAAAKAGDLSGLLSLGPVDLCRIAWSLIEDQRGTLEFTAFCKQFGGLELEALLNALLYAVSDFFPLTRKRLTARLPGIIAALDREIDERISQASDSVAGSGSALVQSE